MRARCPGRRTVPGDLLDRSQVTSRAWRVTGFPTLYVLDRNGVVRSASAGYDDSDVGRLSKLITRLENERPGGRPRKRTRGAPANVAASSAADARARAMGVEVLH